MRYKFFITFSLNAQDIMKLDNRFVYKRCYICKSCYNRHFNGCCDEYNILIKLPSLIILFLIGSQKNMLLSLYCSIDFIILQLPQVKFNIVSRIINILSSNIFWHYNFNKSLI